MSTIKQIAQKAGVSPTTVSNVLHGNTAKVSKATLERVEAIIRKEKYAPNMGAIILAHSNSRIIGVVLFKEARSNETVMEDPFSSAIVGAMEREIRMSGYFMMLHITTDEDEVVRIARTWKLDGLILLWVPEETSRIIKRSIDTPVVFVDCYFAHPESGYHNVGLDDLRGGYEMAGYLLSMGHRRILFLADSRGCSVSDQTRFEGCRQAFRERGLAFSENSFILLSKDSHKREAVYKELAPPGSDYTALFFSADYYAAEAVSFFQQRDIEVPGQLSVAGFDDNMFSRFARPRLTTVHQDVSLKGKTAVSLVMRLIKGEPVPERDVRLPVRLEIRDSVRRI